MTNGIAYVLAFVGVPTVIFLSEIGRSLGRIAKAQERIARLMAGEDVPHE